MVIKKQKINLKDFTIKQPISASEKGIVFEERGSLLETAFKYYKDPEDKDEEKSFPALILQVKKMGHGLSKIPDMIRNSVVKKCKVASNELNSPVDFNSLLKSEMKKIFFSAEQKLLRAFHEEEVYYKKLLSINKNIVVLENKAYVKIAPINYVLFTENDLTIEISKIHCEIRYCDFIIDGFVSLDQNSTPYDSLALKNLIDRYEKNKSIFRDDKIEICIHLPSPSSSPFKASKNNQIVKSFLEELIRGMEIDKAIIFLKLSIPLFHITTLIKTFKIFPVSKLPEIDGFPLVFVAVSDKDSYYVDRTFNSYSITKRE